MQDGRKADGGKDVQMRVLIAEDQEELSRGLKFLLEKQNMSVDVVHNGVDALEFFHRVSYDVIVLDIMMPGMDGLSVLKQIRKEKSSVAVMLLTAKSEVEDRVTGLEAGADDYLPKPFASREFVARVKALSRRSSGGYNSSNLKFGQVELDRNCYELKCGCDVVRLNNKEFQLIELFFHHPHFVFSTEHLMDKIWGADSTSGMDVVWTYIAFLRKKLKLIGADIEIKTVRGAGYSLEEIKC